VAVCQHEPALHSHLAVVPGAALSALPRLFRALPLRLAPTASVTSPTMEALLRHLNFYSSVTKAAHQVSALWVMASARCVLFSQGLSVATIGTATGASARL
jgi:hypothetical protein